jgi:hypothetical protein
MASICKFSIKTFLFHLATLALSLAKVAFSYGHFFFSSKKKGELNFIL